MTLFSLVRDSAFLSLGNNILEPGTSLLDCLRDIYFGGDFPTRLESTIFRQNEYLTVFWRKIGSLTIWRFLREIGSIDRLIICLFELETIQLILRTVDPTLTNDHHEWSKYFIILNQATTMKQNKYFWRYNHS